VQCQTPSCSWGGPASAKRQSSGESTHRQQSCCRIRQNSAIGAGLLLRQDSDLHHRAETTLLCAAGRWRASCPTTSTNASSLCATFPFLACCCANFLMVVDSCPICAAHDVLSALTAPDSAAGGHVQRDWWRRRRSAPGDWRRSAHASAGPVAAAPRHGGSARTSPGHVVWPRHVLAVLMKLWISHIVRWLTMRCSPAGGGSREPHVRLPRCMGFGPLSAPSTHRLRCTAA